MSLLTITIDDIGKHVGWLIAAFRDRYVPLTSSVGIRFKGSPVPQCEWLTNCLVMSWEDGAEIDLPGVDPDIERIVIFPDRATIELAYAPDVQVRW